MSKYLITTTETYRADSEKEVEALIAEAKESSQYELVKYSSQLKESKAKGEVIDSWYRVTLTKAFTEEKDPIRSVNIIYGGEEF